MTFWQHKTLIIIVPSSNSPSLSSHICTLPGPFKDPNMSTLIPSNGNTELPIWLCMGAPDFSGAPLTQKPILEVCSCSVTDISLRTNLWCSYSCLELLEEEAPGVPTSTQAISLWGLCLTRTLSRGKDKCLLCRHSSHCSRVSVYTTLVI